jgi:Fic family protein
MSKIGNFIQQPAGYKAFIPASFPPKDIINWDSHLIKLLSEADLAIGRLKEIELAVPDVDFFIFMYIKKEASLSSQIEGTQATIIDLLKSEAKLDDEVASDVDEIKNYINAMNYGIHRLKELPLSLRLIREIHKKLLTGVRGQYKTPGEFRKTQNWIGGPSIETATFVPPPITEVLRAMSDLEKFIHNDTDNIPILAKAGLIHAQFETIHPFLDGNGRVGRLLITFYLVSKGLLKRPLLYLSDFFKKYRQLYYEKLNSYHQESNGIELWLKFFFEAVKTVANEAADTALEIMKLRQNDIQTVAGFGRNAKTALILLDKLYSLPLVDWKMVAKITRLKSKSTINDLIDKFVKNRILDEITGKKKNRRFVYRQYLNKFSRDKVV